MQPSPSHHFRDRTDSILGLAPNSEASDEVTRGPGRGFAWHTLMAISYGEMMTYGDTSRKHIAVNPIKSYKITKCSGRLMLKHVETC